jgi:uroporphyrinogen III methyltransferase / synthase
VTASAAGTVFLVGAGPGDPGLATRRALELIAEADTIVYDRLVSARLLEGARPGAELIYAGKRPDDPGLGQEQINRLLIDRARGGKRVVRLKGGDPFVFGRGGEEAAALAEADVSFEVVPGVTAGVAAPAYAGIPVTHRGVASAVAFVTAHEDPEKDTSALDWAALATFPGTLVFYMGVRSLGAVAERLIRHGRPPEEPVAVVEQGTLPGQQTVTATLEEIAERVQEKGMRPPAVTVVGPVAKFRELLGWIERAPLHGKTVAVTRARPQASALAERLSRLGAEVVEAPAIRIVPKIESPSVREAVRALAAGAYDIVCLTSPNGAGLLLEALEESGLDARALAGVTLAAIGPGTAGALARGGLRADVVPERSVAESLAAELTKMDLAGRRVLIARAAEARDVLPNALREAGAKVEVVALYERVREELGEEELAAVGRADYVTFTSSSTVRNFLDALGGAERLPAKARVVSIGPVTSATARELGLNVDVEAERHDVDGLLNALLADALVAVEQRSYS